MRVSPTAKALSKHCADHPEVLAWFESAAAGMGHEGFASAVAAAWAPIEATEEQRAQWADFEPLNWTSESAAKQQGADVAELGIARGGTYLDPEEQARFAGHQDRSRL